MTAVAAREKIAEWRRLKALVLDSVSSPITWRVYNMALDEFVAWFRQEPRPGFTKATISAWRVSLEARGLGSSSIIIRMSAIRKLAVEAADNGLLAPELAAGISRVKSAKSVGIRVGNWLSLRQAQALLSTPDVATVKGLRDRAILSKTSFDTIEECRFDCGGPVASPSGPYHHLRLQYRVEPACHLYNGSGSSNPCNQFHRHTEITIEHGFMASRELAAGPGEPMPAGTQRTDYETRAGC